MQCPFSEDVTWLSGICIRCIEVKIIKKILRKQIYMNYAVIGKILTGKFLAFSWPQTFGRGYLQDSPIPENFPDFLCMCFATSSWELLYTSDGRYDIDLLFSTKYVKFIFPHLLPHIYEFFKFCAHIYIISLLTHIDFHRPLVAKRIRYGDFSGERQRKFFWISFYM